MKFHDCGTSRSGPNPLAKRNCRSHFFISIDHMTSLRTLPTPTLGQFLVSAMLKNTNFSLCMYSHYALYHIPLYITELDNLCYFKVGGGFQRAGTFSHLWISVAVILSHFGVFNTPMKRFLFSGTVYKFCI